MTVWKRPVERVRKLFDTLDADGNDIENVGSLNTESVDSEEYLQDGEPFEPDSGLQDGENFDGQGTSEFTDLASVSTDSVNNTHYVSEGADIADEIDIAESNGRSVILAAPGEYTIDSRLFIPEGTSLIGSGIGKSLITSENRVSVRLDEPNTMLRGFSVETAQEDSFRATVDVRETSDNKMRIITECEVKNIATSSAANGIGVNGTSGSAWIINNIATSDGENGIRVRGNADECFVFGNFADSISVGSTVKPTPVDDYNHVIL